MQRVSHATHKKTQVQGEWTMLQQLYGIQDLDSYKQLHELYWGQKAVCHGKLIRKGFYNLELLCNNLIILSKFMQLNVKLEPPCVGFNTKSQGEGFSNGIQGGEANNVGVNLLGKIGEKPRDKGLVPLKPIKVIWVEFQA